MSDVNPMADWREQAKSALEEPMGRGYSSLDNFLGALVDAVSPIIRADERERLYAAAKANSGAMFGIVLAAEQIEAEVYERLRAQVEALAERIHGEAAIASRPGQMARLESIASDLLALLGGESDG